MKQAITFLLFAGMLTAQVGEVPRKAIDFAVQTGPGKYTWLSEYAGKTVVLTFILTTCPHCQFTTQILNRLEKEYAPKGVVFIESAIEPMSSLHIPDFVKKMGVPFLVGYDQESYAATFLGAGPNNPMMMPQMAIIDGKGIIRAQFAGDDPLMVDAVQEQTIREAIEGAMKPAAPAAPARKVLKPVPETAGPHPK